MFVRCKRFLPRFAKIRIGPYTARIGMFENRDGRLFKLADQTRRGADVENVIEGKFFAMKFLKISIKIAIERSGLVRIFSVTQPRYERNRK